MDIIAIGKRIRLCRIKAHLTQMELAEKCGISSVHLSHIETGKVIMSLDCMLKICVALETTPNYILLCEYSETRNDSRFFGEHLAGLTHKEIEFLVEAARLLGELKLGR